MVLYYLLKNYFFFSKKRRKELKMLQEDKSFLISVLMYYGYEMMWHSSLLIKITSIAGNKVRE